MELTTDYLGTWSSTDANRSSHIIHSWCLFESLNVVTDKEFAVGWFSIIVIVVTIIAIHQGVRDLKKNCEMSYSEVKYLLPSPLLWGKALETQAHFWIKINQIFNELPRRGKKEIPFGMNGFWVFSPHWLNHIQISRLPVSFITRCINWE